MLIGLFVCFVILEFLRFFLNLDHFKLIDLDFFVSCDCNIWNFAG